MNDNYELLRSLIDDADLPWSNSRFGMHKGSWGRVAIASVNSMPALLDEHQQLVRLIDAGNALAAAAIGVIDSGDHDCGCQVRIDLGKCSCGWSDSVKACEALVDRWKTHGV